MARRKKKAYELTTEEAARRLFPAGTIGRVRTAIATAEKSSKGKEKKSTKGKSKES